MSLVFAIYSEPCGAGVRLKSLRGCGLAEISRSDKPSKTPCPREMTSNTIFFSGSHGSREVHSKPEMEV